MNGKRIHAFALAAVTVMATASESRADEAPTTYTVQAGDTCIGIAMRFYGDKRFVDVIHAANPGMGPSPHALKAGTQLIIPPKPADAGAKPDATVTRIKNEVEVTTTAQPVPAKGNDPLFRGNRVGTKASSAADVTFRDETQVKLGEETLVVILGDTDAGARRVAGTDVTLVTGELRARLSQLTGKKPESHITTDAGVVAMKSGEAKVSADESKTTRVAVYQGGSTLTAQKKTVAVSDGFGSKAPKGSAPTPPQPLPPPPTWTSPAAAFVAGLAPAELVFSFAPTPGATPAPAGWHVQLARDPQFDDVIVDEKTPLGVRRLDAKNLKSGTYFARVSSIDADRFEGKWTPAVHSRVEILSVNELPGRRARVQAEGAGVTCTIDDAPASLPAEVDGDRVHRIACRTDEAVTSVVELQRLPIEHARVDVEPTALRQRSGFLRVTVTDEHGHRIAQAHPVVEPTRDLEIGELREIEGKGVYTAAFQWNGPPRATPLRVHLRESAVVDTPAVDFPREASKFEKVRAGTTVEIGAAALGSWGTRLNTGFDVDGQFALPTTRGAILLGGSGGWASATEDSSWVVDMRAVGGYRYGHGFLSPYATLGPEILRQHVERGGSVGRQWLLGGSAAIGVDAAVGPGAFFAEARARVVAEVAGESPTEPGSAAVLLVGYRLRLHADGR